MKTFLSTTLAIALFCTIGCTSSSTNSESGIIPNKFKSFKTIEEDGLLGERGNLWRNNRMWDIAESGYLIGGFENRPGVHPWQGEHLGKWLHAATLAYNITGDEHLKDKMDEMVERLLATQLEDGYLGTYASHYTFMAVPENHMAAEVADDIQPDVQPNVNPAISDYASGGGWDTWTIRYNIYGLLTYHKYFPSKEVLEACKKMGDLLIRIYGEGKYDLSKYGTRQGISSTTLLESIVMLYEATLEKKYLDFAERIVEVSEENPKLRLMGRMLEKGSVVYPGDGKGYQLMANLLGYLRLYRSTGDERYLQTALHGWHEIYEKHLLTTGGPWTRKMPYNGNKECFAHQEAFHPSKVVVEGCCDATWVQLGIHLFELTGDAKYFNEAEVTLMNTVYGHQLDDGIEWCYYTKPNESNPPFNINYHCCASSQPRGMQMYSSYLAGEMNNSLIINTLFPSVIQSGNQFGGGEIKIEGNFPLKSSATILLETETGKDFTLEYRLPANTTLASVLVNGSKVSAATNERGFVELNRKWEMGDIVEVDLDFQLKAHLQDGEDGKRWVAFTYGPLALAQKIDEMPTKEVFKDLDAMKPSEIIKRLNKTSGSEVEFSISGTDILLVPYYQTKSKLTGPKTYFKL
ncbi:MAG TPA: beta-L-arabinofuranosidase domain-containing protein [Bacteroidales bacterium]|nr:beta-L-arabinofuranosidase domain-containing protein [Bacteroidales bacterium]